MCAKDGELMNRYVFAVPSVTIALRAKDLLRSEGYDATVSRTPKTLASGCGYSVITSAEADAASEIFEKNGIKIRAVGKYGG